MKSFVCAVLIFLLILAGAGAYTQALEAATDRLSNQLFMIEYYIAVENWTAGREAFDTLKTEWTQTEKWLKAIVSHREIEQIQITLCELIGYIVAENKDEASVKASVLREYFHLLPSNESLSFVNIL